VVELPPLPLSLDLHLMRLLLQAPPSGIRIARPEKMSSMHSSALSSPGCADQ
jgi:hypothetical protein